MTSSKSPSPHGPSLFAPAMSTSDPPLLLGDPSTPLTIQEKLLFSQAVHQVGVGSSSGPSSSSSSKWGAVRDLLEKCPVIKRAEGWFSEEVCGGVYEGLGKEAGVDLSNVPNRDKPNAEAHLELAQYFYQLRMEEIRSEIEKKEEKFRSLVTEINAIKSGQAIYNPHLMHRLKDILLAQARSNPDPHAMDVDVGINGEIPSPMTVEMLVGDESTGVEGSTTFRNGETGEKWVMRVEDLRVAARGELPASQAVSLKKTLNAEKTKEKEGEHERERDEPTVEDAPIQAQETPRRKPTPTPTPEVRSRPSSSTSSSNINTNANAEAGPSKIPPALTDPVAGDSTPKRARSTVNSPAPAPTPSASAPGTPQIRGRGDRNIRPVASRTTSVSSTSAGVPASAAINANTRLPPPPSVVGAVKPVPGGVVGAGQREEKEKERVRDGVEAMEVDDEDVVPDSQENESRSATSDATGPSQATPTPTAAVGTALGSTPQIKVDGPTPMEVDHDPDVVPSSSQNEQASMADEQEIAVHSVRAGRLGLENGSEDDDLTPPPMSPNLPPAAVNKPASTSTSSAIPSTSTTSSKPVATSSHQPQAGSSSSSGLSGSEKRKIAVEEESKTPDKRRRTREPSPPAQPSPAESETGKGGSGDELSPAPSTPAKKKLGRPKRADRERGREREREHEAEVETEGEGETEAETERERAPARGRPRRGISTQAKSLEDVKDEKVVESEDEDEGTTRKTRRQEVSRRTSTRNVQPGITSPEAPSTTGRRGSSRPTPERSIRGRPSRTNTAKSSNREEPESVEPDSAQEDGKAESSKANARRSTRQVKAMPDLREDDDSEVSGTEETNASPVPQTEAEKKEAKRIKDKERYYRNKAMKEEKAKQDGQQQRDRAGTGEAGMGSRRRTRGAGNEEGSQTGGRDDDETSTQQAEDAASQQQDVEMEDVEVKGKGKKAEKPALKVEPKVPEQSRHTRQTSSSATPARSTRSAIDITNPSDPASKLFKSKIQNLHREILDHKHGPVFNAPVRVSDAPGYYEIIKQPMDLKMIKANIREGRIKNIDDFQRDLWLMFCNAMMYNKPGSEVYHMAEEMMLWCEQKIVHFRNAEALAAFR